MVGLLRASQGETRPVGVALIPRYGRVLRAQALSVKARSYIEAARVSGASHVAQL
jgi:ABC-type dipeptide/oligopeptide/nickel transport system permease subunit